MAEQPKLFLCSAIYEQQGAATAIIVNSSNMDIRAILQGELFNFSHQQLTDDRRLG